MMAMRLISALLLLSFVSSESKADNLLFVPPGVQFENSGYAKPVTVRMRMYQLPLKTDKLQKKETIFEIDRLCGHNVCFQDWTSSDFCNFGLTETPQDVWQAVLSVYVDGKVELQNHETANAELKITIREPFLIGGPLPEESVTYQKFFEVRSRVRPGVKKIIWLETSTGRPKWLELTVIAGDERDYLPRKDEERADQYSAEGKW